MRDACNGGREGQPKGVGAAPARWPGDQVGSQLPREAVTLYPGPPTPFVFLASLGQMEMFSQLGSPSACQSFNFADPKPLIRLGNVRR